MVYCGRPSSACHACRKAAAKCDRQKPCCGQCQRKGVQCPGYWDPKTVVIRDQTSSTIRKAAAKDPAKYANATGKAASRKRQSLVHGARHNSSAGSTGHVGGFTPTLLMDHLQPPQPGTLSPTLEEVAITFFWSFYAPNTSLSSLFILGETSVMDQLPLSVIIAPALAMMAQETGQPALMDAGRKHYSSAIKDISHALESVEVAKRDTTLVSVLLISLFDSIAPKFDDSPSNWAAHMDGAVQLMRLRGQDQLSSQLGRAMVSDVSGFVYTACVQGRAPVPDIISEMRGLLHKRHGDDPGIGLGRVAESMLNLAAQMKSPTDAESLGPHDILSEASRINDELTSLLSDLGNQSPFSIRKLSGPSDGVYNSTIHDYQSPQAARHWNVLRLMRMFVSKWIFRAASTLHCLWANRHGSTDAPNYLAISQAAALTTEVMVADILASVPSFRAQPSWTSVTLSAARWLIWPLWYIAGSDLAPVSARIYSQTVLSELSRFTEALEGDTAQGQMMQLSNSFHLYHIS